MSREDAQVNFRIPHALKHKLVQAAHVNKRSVTAELVARLEESFAGEVRPNERRVIEESVKTALVDLIKEYGLDIERIQKGARET